MFSNAINKWATDQVGNTNADPSFWSWDNWIGNTAKGNAGILPVAANAGSALMQGWAGIQQLNLAKRQQKFAEQMSAVNLANQASAYNRQINDLAANRERLNAAKYGTANSYMDKWAAKGTIGG